MRHICMVPSNTLSSTDASKFALKIIESPIIRDYLSTTHGTIPLLVAQVPNDEDWWDTVNKSSYADVISRRHKGKPSYGKLMAEKNLRWPDISTFNGPTFMRFGLRPIEYPKRGKGRSEIYEIKPNNPRGEKDALQKLTDIEDSYSRHGISGIYKRGLVYPAGERRTIYIETPFIKLFDYLVNLVLRPLKVKVKGVSIDLERKGLGCLLYKICVDLDGVENRSKDELWRLANFAVRMLWECHHAYEKAQVRAAAMEFFETLQPDDPTIDPKKIEWIVAGRDLRKIPYLIFKVISLASEMNALLDGIRHTMYSRLMGATGERYMICCDEPWYQGNIAVPGMQKVSAQIKMMSMGSLSLSSKPNSFIMLTVPVLLTADKAIGEIPLIGPVYRWAMNHLGTVLIITGCTIALTAAVLALVGTGGASAPGSLPVAGAALDAAGAAIAAETAVSATATATGSAVGGMAAPVMAANTTAGATLVSVGTAEVVEGTAVIRGAGSLVSWARAAAQVGVTAGEASTAAAENTAQQLLIKIMSEAAVKTAVKVAVGALGTGAVVGLNVRPAYAYSGDVNSSLSIPAMGELVNVEVGKLYVLPLPKVTPSGVPAIPELYKEFNADDYRLLPNEKTGKQMLHMLGCIEIV